MPGLCWAKQVYDLIAGPRTWKHPITQTLYSCEEHNAPSWGMRSNLGGGGAHETAEEGPLSW